MWEIFPVGNMLLRSNFPISNFPTYFFLIFIVYLTLFYVHEGIRSPATGYLDSCELPCGCWELNLGPLEEQSVLLTTEPFL